MLTRGVSQGWNPWSVEDPSINGWGHGGNGMKLRNASIALVQAKHPTWNASRLLAEAEKEYLTACVDFLLATIQECKKLRPKAKWAMWNYPETTYVVGNRFLRSLIFFCVSCVPFYPRSPSPQ